MILDSVYLPDRNPFRQTLMAQTGQTIPQRQATLRRAYALATAASGCLRAPTILIR